MTNTGGQNWTAPIPHRSAGNRVYYYIQARTNNGKYFSKPMTAPLGNWQFDVTGTTGISGNSGSVPDKFSLYQNYPNPFNPVTKIKIDIPSSGGIEKQNVRLTVYDVLGRLISVITDKSLKPGTYEYTFDGSNLPSGIYFYRLNIENTGTGSGNIYSFTRKMILLK